jgi:DNA-binding response OmpR family regulator
MHRILVVDDDPVFGKIARRAFAAPGRAVDIAEDGAQALTALRTGPADLVLVDLDMPGMDGFSLIRSLRALPGGDDTPVIVVTNRRDLASIDLSYRLGAVSFVAKPVNWRLLPFKVQEVLRRRAPEPAPVVVPLRQ